MPTRPLRESQQAQLDAVPDYRRLREPQLSSRVGIRAVIDPRRLEFGVPLRSDILVLQMLKDNLGVRPFYVSRTTASLRAVARTRRVRARAGTRDEDRADGARRLGRHGAGAGARLPRRAAHDGAVARYRAPAAIIRRGDWVDRPSAGIPALYTSTALVLAQAAEIQGRSVEAEKLRTQGIDIAEAAHITEWFLGSAPSAPPPRPGTTRQPERRFPSGRSTAEPANAGRRRGGGKHKTPRARGCPGAREVL
jgi:hypothetical protein